VGLKPVFRTTTSFSALTLSVGSFDPQKPIPDMTYNVFSGSLNPTQSVSPGECLRLQFSCDCMLMHLTNKIVCILLLLLSCMGLVTSDETVSPTCSVLLLVANN